MIQSFIREPGKHLRQRLDEWRDARASKHKRRLKLQQADRPIMQFFRAALGLSIGSAPRASPVLSIRHRRGETSRRSAPPIWIVVPSGIAYFRFVESKALSEIDAAYRVTYVFPDPSNSKHRVPRELDQLNHGDILFVPIDEERYNIWSRLFEVSCRALAPQCASFRIRSEIAMQSRVRKASTGMRRLFVRMVPVLGSRPLFGIVRRNIVRSLGADPAIAQALAEDRPIAIVMPSSLNDSLTNEIIVSSRTLRIPTIVLQTSWDNISSKGIIATQPDIMGVWGEQSRKHAIALQGMARKRCAVIGSPYYESFFRRPVPAKTQARRIVALPEAGLIALFAGSLRQFDEAAMLQQIEQAIDENRLPKMRILYRPHPGRELREETNFFDLTWKYTEMDEEVAVVYRANQEGRSITQNEFGYDLDRLADIYSAVDFTVSPMSSVVLESLIFGLPVLGIGYSDGRNVWGPEKTSQMTHFEELEEVPCVKICRTPERTLDDLATVIAWSREPSTAAAAQKSARYFVDNGEVGYAKAALALLRNSVPGIG